MLYIVERSAIKVSIEQLYGYLGLGLGGFGRC
jgi:hypothetical protein